MSDSLPNCLIQGNADIAGVGIRASIYIQAGLGSLCLLFLYVESVLLSDKQAAVISAKHCKLLDEISLTLLLTGTALITSTLIEAKASSSSGLSPYHTLIVLNLSWLNNVTGFTLNLFTFFVRTRSTSEDSMRPFTKFFKACWAFTLHCIIMSIVGIWFWADPNSFSRISEDTPCVPLTYYWLFRRIPLPNDKLRLFSLITYAATSIPIINIVMHLCPWILFFLVFHLVQGSGARVEDSMALGFLVILIGPTVFFITSTEMLIEANAEFVDLGVEEKWTFGQTLAIFLAAVSVYMILLHIKRQWKEVWDARKNKSEIRIKGGFGDMAALLLATQGRKFRMEVIKEPVLTEMQEARPLV